MIHVLVDQVKSTKIVVVNSLGKPYKIRNYEKY
jgi:hypothetical protein